MRILQLIVDYYYTDLYSHFLNELRKQAVSSDTIVPTLTDDKHTSSEVVNLPCYTRLDRLTYFSKQRKMVNSLCRLGDMVENTDCIHAHTLFSTGLAALRLSRKYHKPYIVAIRNTDVNLFMRYCFFLRPLWNKILSAATNIVFLSPAYRENVLMKYVNKRIRSEVRNKTVVIPNGIDDLFFNSKRPFKSFDCNDVHLIYVGSIDRNKNIELTISALDILIKQGVNVSLQIVGEIIDDRYSNIIMNHPHVNYHEKCGKEEVMEFLDRADIFVMPSHYETFGLVYAEAMSRGLPVIYTRGQGFDGFFEDGIVGYATSDKDSEELAQNIIKISNDYASISENCVNNAGLFSWHKIVERYYTIYINSYESDGISDEEESYI